MQSNDTDSPRLAPPGAGLPILELYVARALFWIHRRAGDLTIFTAQFKKEHRLIREKIAYCTAPELAQRVLIKRLRGLEDSSRHWSVLMTLDHLRITNTSFGNIITSLRNGVVPEGTASTAEVKPSSQVTPQVVDEFEKSCETFVEIAAKASAHSDPKTRYAHPWFGPLTANDWHALAAFHIRLHRRQIERILANLGTR